MKELQDVLDDCLRRIATGQSTMEECLGLYPEQARELRPLLQTAGRFSAGARLRPSSTFRGKGRARAIAFARSHASGPGFRLGPARRLAVGLAVLVLAFLATTTVLAQSASPGEPLYPWKRATEEVWRAISPDPVGTDLDLVDRRAQELVIAANAGGVDGAGDQAPMDSLTPGEAQLQADALQGLHLAIGRLNADDNPANQQRIENALKQQQKKLEKAGVHDKVLDDAVNNAGKSKNKP